MKRKKIIIEFSSLAEAVSFCRKKLGITQREVSRRTGIDNNTIAKIERGERKKPNMLSLKKLAYCLNINPDYLLTLAGYSESEIEIANRAVGANVYMHGRNNEIYLAEEVIIQGQYKKMAFPAIVELIKTCDVNNLKCLKDKSEQEKKKVKAGLKYFLEDYIKEQTEKIEWREEK